MAGGLRDLARRPRHLGRRSCSVRSPVSSSCAAPGRARRSSWTPSPPACCSRRGSAGSATGGTRSSTASRRRSPGGSKIDLAHRAGLAAAVPEREGLPADLPLRAALGPRRASRCCSGSARRYRIRPPALFALYVAYYCFGRFFEELLRIDPSHHFARPAPQRLGLDRLLRRRERLLRLVAAARARRPAAAAAPTPERRPRPLPEGPRMAIPRGRVR